MRRRGGVCVCVCVSATCGLHWSPGLPWGLGWGVGEMCSSMFFEPVLHASFWCYTFLIFLLLQIPANDFVDAALG